MSERRNDDLEQGLDEVRRVYRALPPEEVPPVVDARVLEAAKAALARKRRPAWIRWSGPVALAASVLVVVAVVLEPAARREASVSSAPQLPKATSITGLSADTEHMEEHPAEQAPEAKQVEKPELPAPAQDPAPHVGVVVEPRADNAHDAPIAAVQVPRVAMEADVPAENAAPLADASPPAAKTGEDFAAGEARSRQLSRAFAREERAPPAAPPPAPAPAVPAQAPPATAITTVTSQRAGHAAVADRGNAEEIVVTTADRRLADWLEKIHELQQAGKKTRADREIRKLKQAYPDLDVERELQALRERDRSQP